MKRLCITILVLMALLPHLAMGQCPSSQERLEWVNGYFDERINSYIEMATATGYSEEDARNKAAQIIITRRGIATGQRVSVQVQDGNIVVTGGNELEVKARIIDEYREKCGAGDYRVSLLVQTAKNPSSKFETVRITNEYPFSSRIFVPGMAQLYKGSTTKGILFIAGEATLISGVVICEGLRASNESKINTTHNAKDKQNYIDKANAMQNMRNGFIAGAALLYAWNVIDGIVAKGKKRVQVSDYADFNVRPYITPNLTSGIKLTLNF